MEMKRLAEEQAQMEEMRRLEEEVRIM